MIRTYKSKKDTKDAVLSSDAAFDAFYIQNIKIKQAKRELSYVPSRKHCSYNSRKIRQRKLVKRIITGESNRSEEASASRSTFLTPDKSIHVNKELDPFDQLFNSIQLMSNETQNVEIGQGAKKPLDPFDQLCNSIQNKSDKEKNQMNDKINKDCDDHKSPQITRDSSLQQLNKNEYSPIIEYQNRIPNKTNSPSPTGDKKDFVLLSKPRERKIQRRRRKAYVKDAEKENLTDSINATNINTYKLIIEKEDKCITDNGDTVNEMAKNISLIKKIADVPNKNCEPLNSLIFKGNFSPSARNSIICSTPVLRKQRDIRGKSIFQLSPISIENLGQRSNCETESNKDESSISIRQDVPSHVEYKATLIHDIDSGININKLHNSISHKKSYFIGTGNVNESMEIDNIGQKEKSVEAFIENDEKTVDEIFLEKSDSSGGSGKPAREQSINNTDFNVENGTEDDSQEPSLILQCSWPIKPFLGFQKGDSNDKSALNSIQSEPVVNNTCSISSNSENSDDESYDTCNSDQSAFVRDIEPKVIINRMNKSLFERYYQKMVDFESFNQSCNSDQRDRDIDTENEVNTTEQTIKMSDCKSFNKSKNETLSDSDLPSYESNKDISVTETSFNSESEAGVNQSECIGTIHTPEFSFSGESEEKVQNYVSYVTTRRRHGKAYYDTASIVENDNETVIDYEGSVSKNSLSESENDLVGIEKQETENESIESNVSKDDKSAENKSVVDIRSLKWDVTNINEDVIKPLLTRKSERLAIQSNLDYNRDTRSNIFSSEPKMGIVLQTGKKWERSLSIYRRMTMKSDHFDLSLLEEEPMLGKGRKYRQSIIDTMEMQDYRGSLHNESINNRTSLCVSKSCRPTTRIVREESNSRVSLWSTTVTDDWNGFLSEDCDDTIVGLSKLSIAEQDCNVTVLEKINEDRVSSARDYVLRRCNQTEALLFDECYPETLLKNCRKIGEGVYGEVFLYRGRDGFPRVMKIVPIAGSVKVNGEQQKDFHEIISEIVIAMELSALRAPIAEIDQQLSEGKDLDAIDFRSIGNATDVFNEVLAVKCVYGSYPSRLLDLWDLFDECKGSENDNPAILPRDQQYIVLELANAGEDLESYQFNNAEQAHALFYQVAFGLAVGEEAFQFEHRDLHWGNVLIAPTTQKWATFVLRGRVHRVARCGVAATIIDYSLSRLSLPLAQDSAALYNDLGRDDALFEAVGDYQFDIYRLMREKLTNDWKTFEPYTNILWLHYIVDKMIVALRYKRTNTKVHKHFLAKLKAIKGRLLEYQSVSHFLLDNEF